MDASSVRPAATRCYHRHRLLAEWTVPVTAAGIIQMPASGSQWNGFVEKFSASGASLVYATYLSGASGSTTPAPLWRTRGRCVHRGDDDRAGLSHGCGAGAEPTGDDGAGHDIGLSDQADAGGRWDTVFNFYSRRGDQFAGDRCGGREPAAGGLDFAGTVSGGQRWLLR